VWSRFNSIARASAYRIDNKPLVFLHLNCRSVYNKGLELWNLVDTTIPMLL
jgi:hypothetical protein